jgi:hypothetical protein
MEAPAPLPDDGSLQPQGVGSRPPSASLRPVSPRARASSPGLGHEHAAWQRPQINRNVTFSTPVDLPSVLSEKKEKEELVPVEKAPEKTVVEGIVPGSLDSLVEGDEELHQPFTELKKTGLWKLLSSFPVVSFLVVVVRLVHSARSSWFLA